MASLITEALTWDSLRCLHQINNHLVRAATEIEELTPNMFDALRISEQLQSFAGITIWKLRDICDFMHNLEQQETTNAYKFEDYLKGKLTRENMEIPTEYSI